VYWVPIGCLKLMRYHFNLNPSHTTSYRCSVIPHLIQTHQTRCYVKKKLVCQNSLVNKANLVYNLFLVFLSVCTCFGRLCVHHQEKQLCYATLGACYSVWMTVWYAHWCIPDSHPHRITSTKCRIT